MAFFIIFKLANEFANSHFLFFHIASFMYIPTPSLRPLTTRSAMHNHTLQRNQLFSKLTSPKTISVFGSFTLWYVVAWFYTTSPIVGHNHQNQSKPMLSAPLPITSHYDQGLSTHFHPQNQSKPVKTNDFDIILVFHMPTPGYTHSHPTWQIAIDVNQSHCNPAES